MSRFVLDASVALKMILVNEDLAPLALTLRDDFENQIHQLIAPDILPAEMGHALTRAERKGVIPVGQGRALFLDFIEPCPLLYPYGDLFDRAMDLSSQVRLGFYDCLYVSLAQEEQCKLVTTDERIVALFPGHVVLLDAL